MNRIPAVFCLLFAFYACKRPDVAAPTTPTTTTTSTADSVLIDSIGVSSCHFLTGERIAFYCFIKPTAPVPINIEWNFGDGTSTTNTDRSVSHNYVSPGEYTVSCTINGKTVTKTCSIAMQPTSPYTAGMNGERRWKGFGKGMMKEFGGVYFYRDSLLDNTFSTTAHNDQTVSMFFYTLKLSYVDTAASSLTFTNCPENNVSITYYYTTDSMVYYNYWTQNKVYGILKLHTY